MNILFICQPAQAQFVPSVAKYVRDKGEHEVKEVYSVQEADVVPAVQWADVVWLEWADGLTAAVTRHKDLLDGKRVVVRLHSYEALEPGFIRNVNWEQVDHLVFVSDNVRKVAIPQVRQCTNHDLTVWTIPNFVDVDRFSMTDDTIPFTHDPGDMKPCVYQGKNLAYIGTVTHKKGPMLMMQAFHALTHQKSLEVVDDEYRKNVLRPVDNNWILHVAGSVAEARYAYYLDHMVKEMGLSDKVVYSGHVADMSSWLRDKHFVVCTSPWESQNMSVMEAMATGCKPLVHNFPGAKDIYDEEYVWTTIDEFVDKVVNGTWEPEKYRKFVLDRYSEAVVGPMLDELFKEVTNEYLEIDL